MLIPDFVLVGAPKCGTTALNEFLSEHPDLHVAKKEYHHFGRDLRPSDYRGDHWDRATYEQLFAGASPGQLTGEASVHYLESKTAAAEIHDRNPEARIIAMIRNPVEVMPALHNMFIWVADEAPNGVIEPSTGRTMGLLEAIDNENERLAQLIEHDDPRATDGLRILRIFHTQVAMYADNLSRYFDQFGRSQVLVIVHDDFRSRPADTYRRVLEFLAVDPTFRPDFRDVNSRRRFRSVRLHRILKNHHSLPLARSVVTRLVPRSTRRRLYWQLFNMNAVPAGASEMSDLAVNSRLHDIFGDDVRATSELLGRDLVELWGFPTPTEVGQAAIAGSPSNLEQR